VFCNVLTTFESLDLESSFWYTVDVCRIFTSNSYIKLGHRIKVKDTGAKKREMSFRYSQASVRHGTVRLQLQ